MTTYPTVTYFRPTPADFDGVWADIPVTWFPDGDAIAYTADPDQAIAAFNAYLRRDGDDTGIDPGGRLELRWVRFEEQPAGSEHTWLVGFADEGDEMAVQAHYLFMYA